MNNVCLSYPLFKYGQDVKLNHYTTIHVYHEATKVHNPRHYTCLYIHCNYYTMVVQFDQFVRNRRLINLLLTRLIRY